MGTSTFVQCNSCGGIYRPVQGDGTLYFHACPGQRVTQGAVVDPVSGKVITPATFTPIANRRDENVQSVDTAGNVVVKSVGTGISPVTDAALLTQLGLLGGSL